MIAGRAVASGEIGPDHIGRAARKAAAAETQIPEYFLSDNVAQMVLLHEILRELRLITAHLKGPGLFHEEKG